MEDATVALNKRLLARLKLNLAQHREKQHQHNIKDMEAKLKGEIKANLKEMEDDILKQIEDTKEYLRTHEPFSSGHVRCPFLLLPPDNNCNTLTIYLDACLLLHLRQSILSSS